MRHQLWYVSVAVSLLILGEGRAQSSDVGSNQPSTGIETIATKPSEKAQSERPLDEQLDIELTRPIPMDQAPPGCLVTWTERFCRADKVPVKSFVVLGQQTVGRSSIEKLSIKNGCVIARVKLGVEEDKTGRAQCVGGKPMVGLKLLLSARAALKP